MLSKGCLGVIENLRPTVKPVLFQHRHAALRTGSNHVQDLPRDMACDIFLKIVQKCKRKFFIVHVGEREAFVSKLLFGLATTVGDLEPPQIHTFYESVGSMIQAEPDNQKTDEYLQRLMQLPNQNGLK